MCLPIGGSTLLRLHFSSSTASRVFPRLSRNSIWCNPLIERHPFRRQWYVRRLQLGDRRRLEQQNELQALELHRTTRKYRFRDHLYECSDRVHQKARSTDADFPASECFPSPQSGL